MLTSTPRSSRYARRPIWAAVRLLPCESPPQYSPTAGNLATCKEADHGTAKHFTFAAAYSGGTPTGQYTPDSLPNTGVRRQTPTAGMHHAETTTRYPATFEEDVHTTAQYVAFMAAAYSGGGITIGP